MRRLRREGTILITSLWILAILSILAIGISFRASIEARLSKYSMDKLKGIYIAKAGILKSRAILSLSSNNYDSIRECGVTLPTDKEPQDVFSQKLGDGTFIVKYTEEGAAHYGMMDEQGKININKAEKAVLECLLGSNNKEIAASIINWRGTVQVPDGAWDDYYNGLTPSYECKHGDFSCVEELMLVKDVSPELFESIKDYITVYGDGKININTVTKRAMLALGLSENAAEIIIKFRNGDDNIAGTKDDGSFSDMSQAQSLLADPDAYRNDIAILGNGNIFTTRSNHFRIISDGAVDNSRVHSVITCVVDKGAKKLEYYREY